LVSIIYCGLINSININRLVSGEMHEKKNQTTHTHQLLNDQWRLDRRDASRRDEKDVRVSWAARS